MASRKVNASASSPISEPTVEILEGNTRLLVPRISISTANPPRQPAFFNPLARVCRDLSVIVTGVLARPMDRGVTVGDALAGVGSRGIRLAAEIPEVDKVYLNDLNPSALAYAAKAAKINGVFKKCRFSSLDACSFLIRHSVRGLRLSFVDIDPFGSPSPFIDCGLRAVKDEGVLSVTATDSAVLCGYYPEVAQRRYYGTSLKTEYAKETGARLLTGLVTREAARLNLSATPIFAHTDHLYTRLYFRIFYGVEKANEAAEKLGYINHCYSCNLRSVSPIPNQACRCGATTKHAGPLWTSSLHDPSLAREAYDRLSSRGKQEIKTILFAAADEVDMPPYYYHLDREASRIKAPPPKLSHVLRKLREKGYKASRCVFDPKGFKTDAPPADIQTVLKVAADS